jgi:hypothetical protein
MVCLCVSEGECMDEDGLYLLQWILSLVSHETADGIQTSTSK